MPECIPTHSQRLLRGHIGPVNAVRFNEMGSYVMTCGQDKSIRLWNPHRDGLDSKSEGLLIKTYAGRHGYDVRDVSIACDNAQFASCGRDKAVFIWDVPTGKVIRKLEGHEHAINCVQYNFDASVLASGSYDKTVRLWDMRARNSYLPIQILKSFKDSVTCLALTNHQIIAGSVDGILRTYDLRKGKLYSDHLNESIVSLALSQDEQQILVSCMDRGIRLVDRETGTEMNTYRGHKMDEYKLDCVFSIDGSYVLSGSEDGRVCFWDLVTKKMESFQAHGKPLRSMAMHPNENMLATACTAGSVKIWTPNNE